MITSGFYDGVYYNADSMSEMFDGVIKEGVFQGVGNVLAVTANGGMEVAVDSGKAWVGKRWIKNDAKIILTLDEAPYVNSRIDAIVLESNNSSDPVEGHDGTIKVLKGIAEATPSKPTLEKSEDITQMALAYIKIASGTTAIQSENIEIVTGLDETPWVTGLIETASMAILYQAWRDSYTEAAEGWETSEKARFQTWFANLQNELDSNQAAHLQHEIDDIWAYFDEIGRAENETY